MQAPRSRAKWLQETRKLQLLAAAPANLEYLPSVPVDWSARSAFPDAEEAPRDRIDVLLEQVQLV